MNLHQVRMLQFDKYFHFLHHAFVLGVVFLDKVPLNTLGTQKLTLLHIFDVLAYERAALRARP